jgi:hypothetical protein
MGTWDSVRLEIKNLRDRGEKGANDLVRRDKINKVEELTKRPLVIYASNFTDDEKAARFRAGLTIDLNDKTGFAQALSDIPSGPLDILLHSPGGSPTATESLVHLIRKSYNPVRFIIPHTIKSAATMFALSGDEILVSEQAEFGPIDPQLRFPHEGRVVNVPAQAAIDQFDRAYDEMKQDAKKLTAWLPILRQFGPSFLEECHKAIDLSKELVIQWLTSYMFAGQEDAQSKAEKVAKWLADHNNFKSHSRRVSPRQLLDIEPSLKITSLNDLGTELKSAIMDLYWAIDVTFDNSNAFKIIEHKEGSAYIRLHIERLVAVEPPQSQPASGAPPLNRAERRRLAKGKR